MRKDVFELANHDVDCPENTFLNNFQLVNSESSIKYSFNCLKSKAIGKEIYESSTPINLTEKENKKNKSVNFLNRHNIECKNNYVLQRFKLIKHMDKIHYIFRCVKANCNGNDNVKTNDVEVGKYDLENFKDLKFLIKENQAIKGFQLNVIESLWSNKYEYSINYCTLDDKLPELKINKHESLLLSTIQHDYVTSILQLEKQDVNCTDGVLTGFGLNTSVSEKINYLFNCKSLSLLENREIQSFETADATLTDGNSQSIDSLLKTKINCEKGYALQGFKLERKLNKNGKIQIYYKYSCLKVN